jgi:hypothetical protein
MLTLVAAMLAICSIGVSESETILREQFSGHALSKELPNDSQIAILFTVRLLASFY